MVGLRSHMQAGGHGTGALSPGCRGAGKSPGPGSHEVSTATLQQGTGAQVLKTRASISPFLPCTGILGLYLMRLIPT